MPRSGEDARRRLQQAALELFQARGYDAVTAAEIAAEAGVTERTFFRHFKDKREVLFHGEEAFREALVQGVAAAPDDADPLAAMLFAFQRLETVLDANRAFSAPRERVIATTPALQERMLIKGSGLIAAMAEALKRRGVDEGSAALSAQVGMAVFSHALAGWFADPKPGLGAHLQRAAQALQGLSSPSG